MTPDRVSAFSGEMEWASNMYPCPITFDDTKHNLREIFPQFKFDGLEYPSSEHLYQSLKATNENDKEFVRTAPSPKMAKKIGGEIFERMDWGSVKVEAMRLCLYLKFYQHPDLLTKLLDTGNEPIVEVNWWNDKFWGVCDKTNEGDNWLGRLLMELRTHSKLLLRLEIY